MTAPKPPNSQLTPHPPQTEARPLDLKRSNRPEQQRNELSGDTSRTAAPAAAGNMPERAKQSAVLNQVKPAEHTTPQNPSHHEAERLEIAERIAAFRNLQVKLRQEREAYYSAELARARSLLAKSSKPRR